MSVDLVVGGAGFIGSHLAQALEKEGRRVRILDDYSSGKRENLVALNAEILDGDAADGVTATKACEGVERVFHLAARASVPFSIAHPAEAERANLGTTRALLSASKIAGVSRFIFSSSSAIYGNSPQLPKEEEMEPAPASPYAEHKLAGERLLAEAHESDFGCVSLRYFNVFGPRQDPSSPYSGVISLFAGLAQRGEAASIFGDGSQTRDFIFVDDVVRANLLAGDLPELDPAMVFNVGTGDSVSVLELWESLCRLAGRELISPCFLPFREGDVLHSVCDPGQAAIAMDFRSKIPLEDGLKATLAFYA